MKMFSRLKTLSRAVHEEREHEVEEKLSKYPRIRSEGNSSSISLTVWKKSLLMSCKGFTVIDSYGNLVYRVDNYIGADKDQLTLMDASGNSLITIHRRRKLGLVDNWFVYEGEVGKQRRKKRSNSCKSSEIESPICCVKKHMNILPGNPNNIQAYVYRSDKQCVAFTIEGSYAHRTCKVLDKYKRVVAEIKKKEANTKHVSFGMDIFQLVVQPGFDPAFAMALVLLLDQMFS
ncbi:hypothetical protein TanjilG_22121 [Lupinus angustifolius]|uniref:Tubby C-terminal domain-containing protein n=1 Tax=Lupinus angustifolius TaxID=3871 RepID=A0A4P1QU05_LUPAN|nr:PREDICTED: protein LURP-one-related 17-like [Lupinus angustifolius]OIV94924.1 hypothetical protein TanjilG_22121 [Lupinus angustifolius]